MLRDLRHVVEKSGGKDVEEFRLAASALLQRQFLMLERTRDRDSYRIIVNHFDYFTNLFDALGWSLHRDDNFSFIGLLPSDSETFSRLRMVESLLLLCLRLLYEEGMEKFEVTDGCVFTQSELLLSRYETLLGRKRPQITEFRDVLRTLKRYSMIELGDDTEDGLPMIRIFPTIRLVTGSKVQERIESFILKNEEDAEDVNEHFNEEGS
ncbi:MAG: DUF4194 domain-containing protein [Candidatus Thiodiazotropha endolucinida]